MFRYLWKFIKNRKFVLFSVVLLYIIQDILGIFIAQHFNKEAINYFQKENFIFINGLILIILYIFFNNIPSFLWFLKAKIRTILYLKIANRITNDAFKHTLQHSTKYFNNSFSGDISSKISNIGFNYQKLLEVSVKILSHCLLFVFVLIFYARINIVLCSVFFIFSILYFVFYKKYSLKYSSFSKQKQNSVSNYFGFIVDIFSNIRNVKIFSNYKFEKHNSDKLTLDIVRAEKKLIKSQIKLQFITFMLTFCLMFSVICVSSILLAENKIGYGEFVAVVIVLSISRFFLTEVAKNLKMFYGLKGIIESQIEKIFQPIEITDRKNDKLKVPNGRISFKNVIFSYYEEK